MVKLFCAFFSGVTKTMFQIRRLKHMTNPFSPPPPSLAVHPTHFPRIPRGHRYGNFNHTFKELKSFTE